MIVSTLPLEDDFNQEDTMSDTIQLNIGGTVFATSRATLIKYEDSMLGKMFNGTWKFTTDPEGRYFIDRDGTLFRHILNFLRTGRLLIPDEFPELQLLRCEADFYQIVPLVEAVDREIQRRGQLTICNQGYYLDIAGVNTFPVERGDCRKTLVIVGDLDVIKSLPLDDFILRRIQNVKYFYDGDEYDGHERITDHLSEIQCHTDGELYYVLATTHLNGSDWPFQRFDFRVNQSYLAGILLAKNCSLISSSSAFHKNQTENTYEFHCCDKWRIPIESLKLLSEIPKLS